MTSYQLQYHSRAQIKMKIDHTGQLIVIAPRLCPTFMINQFVESHQDWIEKNVAKVKQAAAKRKGNENTIDLFGTTYTKKIDDDIAGTIGVHLKGKEIIITPVTNTATSIEKTLTNFLKKTATKYIVPRTHQLGKLMGIDFKDISLKNQKTRWGSCSSHGNLNFNWRLVHCPTEVIDYVIIHELAHRREMNHSARFWDIVRQFDPEYLKHRGWLKRQGMTLG